MADSNGAEGSNGGGSSGKPKQHTTEAQAAYAHARAYEHALAYTRARTVVSLVVKGSGLLALLLSSVILLGGFVQSLGKKDFLCITAITVIQSIGIFNDWENNIEYLIDFSFAIMDKFIVLIEDLSVKSAFILLVAYPFVIAFQCVQMIYLLGPFACAAISSWRISKINHGNRDGTESMANMMVALNLFYSLVIFQGSVFGVLFLNAMIGEHVMARHLLAQEQLSEEWGNEAIIKYLYGISVKCRQDPVSIRGMDLIKYAVELLDSESQLDYLYGARLLSVFVKKQGEDVRSLLLPSRHKIQKLIESLRISSSLDEACLELRSLARNRCLRVMSRLDDQREITLLAATIVAELAGHIDLAKYPESMRYISSLLQEETTQTYWNIKQVPNTQQPIGPLTISEQRRHDIQELRKPRTMRERKREEHLMVREERRQWRLVREQKRLTIRKERRPQNKNGDGSYELILQGLTILERLASNNDNCSLICSDPDPGLLQKITAPVYSETLVQDVTIKAWADIVTRSLQLLYNLIRAPGQTSSKLRLEISSNDQALNNLTSILNLGNVAGQELQLAATEILAELALDLSVNLRGTEEIFITRQLQMFLANGEDEESAAMAGRTLVSLSSNSKKNCALILRTQRDIIGRLTAILDANNNIIHRTIAAEITENLCAYCDVDRQHMKEILLPKVLKEIMSIKTNSQQRPDPVDQINPALRDEENQRYSASRNDEEWHNISTKGGHTRIQEEAFLYLTMAICQKLNSADDLDDAIEKTIRREVFVDKLKSIIIDENRQATADSLRIVKLCGRIAESMMQCQQYQQYAEHFRNKGFESLLSEASETMSRLESCMLFLGTDFGLKKTVRPLISDIQLERKSNLEPVERALQEYLAMYHGPLPAEIIAALTAKFNLDNEEEEEMDVELVGMHGEGVGEL